MTKLEDLLQEAQGGDQETQDTLARLRAFYQRRFWHEFGEQLLELVLQRRAFQSGQLVQAALGELAVYLDPLITVELLDATLARSEAPLAEKLHALEELRAPLARNELALAYLRVVESRVRISAGDLEEGLKGLREAEGLVEGFRSVPKGVYASMYGARALYFWKKADLESFHGASAQFLAYADDKKLSSAERLDVAEKALTAALLSDGVLAFGDFLASPAFARSAELSNKKYLWKLAELFNAGDVQQLEAFLVQGRGQLDADELLSAHYEKLQRKVRVIALYDAIFFSQKSFSQQSVTFAEVSSITHVPRDQVEKLVVHVLSIGLLQGYIDEMDELVFITGLKAQELDKTRLGQLKEKYDNWNQNIRQAVEFVNNC